MIRALHSGDAAQLEAFLVRHADFSMFLRSNSRAAGLVYEGKPLQAHYVAAFDGDRIVAVAAHCWNDMLLVQAPVDVVGVARAAVAQSGRPVAGLSGPAEQVLAARTALGLDDRPAPKFGREELFALDLADLVVPAPLNDGRWSCRHPRADELEFLVDWRVDYAREALQVPDSPGLRSECRQELMLVYGLGSNWVLEDGGLVSYSAFNARLPDVVQVGGVWTPRQLRGRGYGRAVVAGSLLEVRETGVRRAVLFAEREDAKRAYAGIGFRVVGEYGLVLFAGKETTRYEGDAEPPGR
jgi:GNAT superfamily N-acetyltransferase